MKTFAIENETNNITIYMSAKEAEAVSGSERFNSAATLAKLADNWSMTRLIEIWNSLPGATPVRKFTDRKTAVNRIWKAIQSLDDTMFTSQQSGAVLGGAVTASVAPQTPDVATVEAPAKTKATRAKKAPVAATNAGAPREGSKTSQLIEMLKREGGATLDELMAKFQWQAHTTRSMLSAGGPLIKKHRLVITSEKVGDKRTYAIKA